MYSIQQIMAGARADRQTSHFNSLTISLHKEDAAPEMILVACAESTTSLRLFRLQIVKLAVWSRFILDEYSWNVS